MPLGIEVGLGPGDIVLDEDPAHSQEKGHISPHFQPMWNYSQTAGWIRIPLSTEVGLGPGDIQLHGDPAPFTERGTAAHTFRPMFIVAKRSPISATC